MNLETGLVIVGVVALAAICFAFLDVANRLRGLQNSLNYERKERDQMGFEFRTHRWEMERALAAAGVKKRPASQPEWVKE